MLTAKFLFPNIPLFPIPLQIACTLCILECVFTYVLKFPFISINIAQKGADFYSGITKVQLHFSFSIFLTTLGINIGGGTTQFK